MWGLNDLISLKLQEQGSVSVQPAAIVFTTRTVVVGGGGASGVFLKDNGHTRRVVPQAHLGLGLGLACQGHAE